MTAQLLVGTAERTDIDIGPDRLAALSAGPPDGPPVLLLPGYTGSKEDFAPILDPLAAAGLRVTALDLPGQFESAGPTLPACYAPSELAASVVAVARTLGPRVRLLGHSFGGLVARAAVIAAPECFASLVLMSSGPARIGGQRRQRIEALAPVLATAGMSGVYTAMQAAALADSVAAGGPGAGGPGAVPPPRLAEFLKARFLRSSPAMLQGMGDALLAEPDRVAELAATGVPTLVLHGVDDDAWPTSVQRAMSARLDARYVVLPGAAHSPAVENPAATADTLQDFWRG